MFKYSVMHASGFKADAPLMMRASCMQASTSSIMYITYRCTIGYGYEGCARTADDAGQLRAGAHVVQLTYGCTVGYACACCARVANDADQLCAGAHVIHDATNLRVYGRIRM